MGWWHNLWEIKPFNAGYLPEKDGHQVFYMEIGNPKGKPILMFHGGPGGHCSTHYAKAFNLKKYRVIGFDQRGCGKSWPQGEIKNNSSKDLLDDATRLLDYLKINEKVILRGGSWGSTLALLWAEKHPYRVDKLLLSQIFLANKNDRRWDEKEAGLFYPEFEDFMRKKAQNQSLATYYAELINSDNPDKQLEAINTYGQWEMVRNQLQPQWGAATTVDEEVLHELRIYINYAARNFDLGENDIIDNIDKITHIPTIIVHNRLDFSCPIKGAYDLYRAMKNAKLIIVPERGHFGKKLSKVRDKSFAEFIK